MRIERIRTVQVAEFPQLVYVVIDPDEGPSGLGESFNGAHAIAAYIHETVAPQLLGKDPQDITAHALQLRGPLGFNGSGIESRGNSAVDLALWDLKGKVVGQPLHQLLGGRSRDSIPIYNTCAGHQYVRQPRSGRRSSNWGLDDSSVEGPYEDLEASIHRPAELAEDLLEQGISAMKIWPFDLLAEETGGNHITLEQLERGLRPIEQIRDAVGTRMEILLEFHSMWNLPSAKRICNAVSELDPFWLEDLMRADEMEGLAALAGSTHVPMALSETLGGLTTFRRLLASGAAGVVIFDVGWAGGITGARGLASLAAAHHVPVAPHDCTGPVVLAASTHLSVHLENALMQETVRAFLSSWYGDLVTELPSVSGGRIRPLEGPGLGLELQPDVFSRQGTRVQTSSLGDR